MVSDPHIYEDMANLQSTIDKVLSLGEQCMAMTQDLLLSIDDRGDNSRVNNTRHSHWGRGPMETGIYMLGTFQALAESSPNVPTRYISFTFQM